MKLPACILIILLSFLLVQPLVDKEADDCEAICSVEMTRNCPTSDEAPQKNDCTRNQCNPLMSCSSGNFYIVEGFYLGNSPADMTTTRLFSNNDNRILTSLSECWHPPELNWQIKVNSII